MPKTVPEGYHSITPYLYIKGAGEAIEFYKKVLGATERMRMDGPEGKIGHAELQIGDSVLMLADEFPELGCLGPKTIGGSAVGLHVYLADVDAVTAKAAAAGAKVVEQPVDKFYGDRMSTIEDPFGHRWYLSQHLEDVAPAEMQRRSQEFMRQQQK